MTSFERFFENLNKIDSKLCLKYLVKIDCIESVEIFDEFLNQLNHILIDTSNIEKGTQLHNLHLITDIFSLLPKIPSNFHLSLFTFLNHLFQSSILNSILFTKMFNFHHFLQYLLSAQNNHANLNYALKIFQDILIFHFDNDTAVNIVKHLIKHDVPNYQKSFLIKILTNCLVNHEPNSYFHFHTESANAIYVANFPVNKNIKGLSFSCWFNIRDSKHKLFDNHKTCTGFQWTPYLFQFFPDKRIAVGLYFTANHIVIRFDKNGSTKFLPTCQIVSLNRWHHLSVSFEFNKLIQTKIHLYFNEIHCFTEYIDLPITRFIVNKCVIGKSESNLDRHQFYGSISSFVIWNIIISQSINETLCTSISKQHIICDSQPLLNSFNSHDDKLPVLKSKSSNNINILLVPECSANSLCYDISPIKYDAERRFIASYSSDLYLVKTHTFKSFLLSRGEIHLFIYLFDGIFATHLDANLLFNYLSFLFQAAQIYPTIGEEIIYKNIFQFIMYSISAYNTIFELPLMNLLLENSICFLKTDKFQLFTSLVYQFLFKSSSWQKWPPNLHQIAISFILTENVNKQSYTYYLKHYLEVWPVAKIIARFYQEPTECETLNKSAQEDMITRSMLYTLMKQILLQDGGFQESELDTALYYIGFKNDEHIYNLIVAMKESGEKKQKNFASAFCNINAVIIFNKLLSGSDDQLFHEGLELFTLVVINATPKSFYKLTHVHHIWSILANNLMKRPLTTTIYEYILKMMIRSLTIPNLLNVEINSFHILHSRVIQVFLWICINNSSSDNFNSCIVLDFLAIIKCIVSVSTLSCLNIYRKPGWQGWLLVFLKLFQHSHRLEKVEQIVIEIIFHVILSGICENEDGWITFIDLLGYIHYFNAYKHFSLIPELLRADETDTKTILDKIINMNESDEELKNNYKSYSTFFALHTSHQVDANLCTFILTHFSIRILSYIFIRFESHFKELHDMDFVFDKKSINVLNNMANIMLLSSDFIINLFGGVSAVFDLATLQISSNITFNCSDLDLESLLFLYKLLDSLVYLVNFFFIANSSFQFKIIEETLDMEQGVLLAVSCRILLTKYLLDVSINNYQYWESIGTIETPIQSLSLSVKDLFTQISFTAKASSDKAHPLYKNLLPTKFFKMFRNLLLRKNEYVEEHRKCVQNILHILQSVMISHYTRIIQHQPLDSEDFCVYIATKSSLNGLSTLIYESIVYHNTYLSQILIDYSGHSILDTSLKKMKLKFDPFEFIMLLTSQSWNHAFETMFKPIFNCLLGESDEYATEAIDQMIKRSCLAADFFIYSTLFVQNSVYSLSELHTQHILSSNNPYASKFKSPYMKLLKFDRIQSAINILVSNSSNIMQSCLFNNFNFKLTTSNSLTILNHENSWRCRFFLVPTKYRYISAEILTGFYETDIDTNFTKITNSLAMKISVNEPKQSNEMDERRGSTSSREKKSNKTISRSIDNIINHLSPVELSPTLSSNNNRIVFNAKLITNGITIIGKLIYSKETALSIFSIDETYIDEHLKILMLKLKITDIKFDENQVFRVFSRSYAHEMNAIEIFLTTKSVYFFVLQSYEKVKELVSYLPEVGIGPNFGLPQTNKVSLYTPTSLFQQSSLPRIWAKGELSNFNYLMFLNTISGRTYQDLSQYPIFPWVLSNYHSITLDLSDSNNYRDFSKPIGVQFDYVRQSIQKQYSGTLFLPGIPPYHHKHYCSSLDIVTYFQIRLEPFGSIRVHQNDDKFENPCHLFNNISETYEYVTTGQLSPRELIPEFFYLPEMFNSHQQIKSINDDKLISIAPVILPPYAATPQEFIQINLLALESNYVSSHLHLWIDLVFGFAQRGKFAEEFLNTYHYLSYQSPLNQFIINDQQHEDIIISQIHFIGVAPCQISINKHPPKMITDQKDYPDLPNLCTWYSISEIPLIYINFHSSEQIHEIHALDENLVLYQIKLNKSEMFKTHPDHTKVHSFKPITIEPLIKDKYYQNYYRHRLFLAHTKFLVIAGSFWDNSIRVFNLSRNYLNQSIVCHEAKINCLTVDADPCDQNNILLATGSEDGTICVWNYSSVNNSLTRILDYNTLTHYLPIQHLFGHTSVIRTISLNSGVGLISSISTSNLCCVHHLNGSLLSSFKITANDTLIESVDIFITSLSLILVMYTNYSSTQVVLYDKFGCIINKTCFDFLISSTDFDVFNNLCAIAYNERNIMIFSTISLEIINKYYNFKPGIISIRLYNNQFILCGLKSGELGILLI